MKKYICICMGREIASSGSLKKLKKHKEVKMYFEKMDKEFINIYKKVA